MAPRNSIRTKTGLKKEPSVKEEGEKPQANSDSSEKKEDEEDRKFRPPPSFDSPDKREDEENIFHQPLSFDSGILDPPEDLNLSSEEEKDRTKADIKPGFGRILGEPKSQVSDGRAVASRGRGKGNVPAYGIKTAISAGKKTSTISTNTSSPKRKSQEDTAPLGSGMSDAFGRINTGTSRNKKRAVYGSSQSRIASSQVTARKSTLGTQKSPDRGFKKPPVSQNALLSDDEDGTSFHGPGTSLLRDLNSTPVKAGFRAEQVAGTYERSLRKLRADLLIPGLLQEDHGSDPPFRVLGLDGSLELPDLDKPLASKEPIDVSSSDILATQREPFKRFDIGGLEGDGKDNSDDDADELGPDSAALPNDYLATQIQLAVCPMCEQSVDPDELKAYGYMNTRMQEKFCRIHQKKTAKEEWETKGYPKIDWKNLDMRITNHHTFIKKLINGTDSYYRQALSHKVDAGKDRSLMKMTSSLTPGYYGSRGLQVISENIMHKFTPLLKKRIVKDRLMSARGFTAYVQAVLVPEAAVLLIMEDMTADIDEAREILKESAGVGELLHEELKDVVRRIEDSEDELAD